MIKGLHHAKLSVLDLDGAIAFFTRGAGLAVERRARLTAGEDELSALGLVDPLAESVLLRGPNGFLEVLRFERPAPGAPEDRPVCAAGVTHICLQHQDMRDLASRFEAAGATFHAAPVALGTGYEYCYIRDAETNVLELEGNPVAPPPPGPWLSHVSISTPDVDRLSAFYGAVLGRGVRATGQYGGNPLIDRITRLTGTRVRVAWLDAGNLGLEIMQYLSPPTTASAAERGLARLGYGCISFEVSDLAAERSRLAEVGVRFHGATVAGEQTISAFGRDPDGNLIQFIEFTADGRALSLDSLVDAAALHRADAAMAASRAPKQEPTHT
jgi:catechol 2,3-dioxygenase-like lactoylglutathione lyase family enzyme